MKAHRGRFLLGDAAGSHEGSGLLEATERLLELGDVQVTSYFTTVQDRKLHHIEVGSGRPLVLLHGACGGGANWYRLLGALAQRQRVIALDLPGFGFSAAADIDPPLGPGVARVVLAWLSAIGVDECDLLGTSFGSLVALRATQQAPARIGRVALVNGVGLGRDLPVALRVAGFAPISQLALRPSRFGTRWQFNELMTAEGRHLPRAHVDALLEYLWQSAQATDQRRMAKAFGHFSGLGGQREILTDDELRAFKHRLLVMWGAGDRFLPLEHGKHAAALVPRALLRIIPDAGHSPNWEAPDAVLECLSAFLENPSST